MNQLNQLNFILPHEQYSIYIVLFYSQIFRHKTEK